jgi:hypothetical protein
LAKEVGRDRFFALVMDATYVQAGADGHDFEVPRSYFKLDPEFNQRGAQVGDLIKHLAEGFAETEAFADHPAAERWPGVRLVFGYGFFDSMVVRVQRRKWHLIDTRPPVINQVVQFRESLDEELCCHEAIADALKEYGDSSVQDSSPPHMVPAYDHVSYCPDGRPPVAQKSIDYKRVLDVGVGTTHHHQQYERISGGEIQPMFIGRNNPDWLLDSADQYRFLNGPIQDADGFNDGTTHFYALVQLFDDAKIQQAQKEVQERRRAYGLLWCDEQSFFTQRWRLASPDDYRALAVSLVDRLQGQPVRYGWKPELYWCPFRTGHVGPRSRLAVGAYVLLVTGEDPQSKEALLCSVNFSFASIDRNLAVADVSGSGPVLWRRVALGPGQGGGDGRRAGSGRAGSLRLSGDHPTAGGYDHLPPGARHRA